MRIARNRDPLQEGSQILRAVASHQILTELQVTVAGFQISVITDIIRIATVGILAHIVYNLSAIILCGLKFSGREIRNILVIFPIRSRIFELRSAE